MIRITIQTGAHTYRISNQSHEHDGYPWRGRLLNVPELELLGKVTDQENPVREIPLAIDNHDGFIDIDTDSIWNATVTYENDNYADTWVGIIARYSESGEKTLSIQATEQTQALFKLMIPDEIVRIANYTDAPRDAANTTIPMIFGGTALSPVRTKAILVDRVNFRYIICLGEIRQIVSVLKNRTAITEGFTSYTGTAGQATYPGFAYIEFASDPRDDAGVWPEILVDVVGLKLGAHTEEECRNPARILYYLLTTARTGACGWGLGRNVSELDASSFSTAISDCDSAGFKIDGAMDEQKYAPQWIDRITSACRGSFGQKAGKWALSIDKVAASVKHYGTGYAKMRVSTRGKGSMTNRKNQFVLNYRYDATDGRFLGFAQRDDVTSQNALGTTNKFEDTNKLVSDHTAAGYIVDYYKRYEEYGEDRIEFTTSDFSGVSKDSVIEITRADFGYSAKKFRVVSISISKRTAKIEARSYDDAIFDNDTPGTPPADPETDPTIPAAAPPNPPGVPADLSLQTNVRVQPDGTVIGYADISFTPAVAALFTRIEVGEGAAPESWVELGVIGESGIYHHEPAKVGQNYTYRLTSVNAGGSSAPVTANVTIAADTTAPLVPQAPVLSTYFKSIAVKCLQNLTKAPDHASFDVYRNTTNNSGTATKIGSAPCLGNTDSVVYLDEATAFDTTYYYWVKSVDTSGNISGFSAVAGPVSTQRIISGDLAAGALNSSALFAAGVVDAAAIANCAVTAAKTCLAAIDQTSGCLTACSVATCNLQAGAITSEKIISTGITGACICAGTITASKMLIAAPGSALNADPAFEDGSNLSLSYGCIVAVTDGCIGAKAFQTRCNGYGAVVDNTLIPVDSTKWYRRRVVARAVGGTGGCSYFYDICYDANKCCLTPALRTFGCPGTSWAVYTCVMQFPACVKYVKAKLDINNGTPGASVYVQVQDNRLEEVLPATLIQDGAITTSKIIATGISGACICAGSITTGHLSASGICADCIKAGTLSGVKVCACDGLIGGWTIKSNYIAASSVSGYISMATPYPSIYSYACGGGGSYATHGKMYWSAGYQDAFGFSITNGTSGTLAAGMGYANIGSVTLPDSSTVACGCPFFWVGGADSYVKYNEGVLSIRGSVEVLPSVNVHPDPGFMGVPYAADCTAVASGTVLGDWTAVYVGSLGCIYTSHKSASCRSGYRYPGSSSIWLYACNISNYTRLDGNWFPVNAGSTYFFSFYAASHPGYNCPRILACIYFYSASGTCLGSCGIDTTSVPNTPTRFCIAATAPATTVRARTNVHNYSSAPSYLYYSGFQVEEKRDSSQSAPTGWKPATGSVTARRIVGGAITSLYWGASGGSCFDLDAGTFYLGGSSAPKLSWDGSSLVVCGTVCATAGCFSGSLNSCVGNIGGWSLNDGYLYGIRNVSGNLSSRTYHIACGQYQKSWFTTKDGLYAEIYQAGIGFLCNSTTGYVMASSLCGTGNRAVYSDASGYLTNTSSDWRLKTNITLISDDLSIEKAIFAIHGVYFNWRQDIERSRNLGTQREIGLIAQDVQKVFPEAVGTNFDGYLSLDYSKLVPVLIEAQKESYARIKSLEDRLCNLETRLAAA